MRGQAPHVFDDELVSILSSGLGDEDFLTEDGDAEQLLAAVHPRRASSSCKLPVRAALAFSGLLAVVLGSMVVSGLLPSGSQRGEGPGLRGHPQEALFSTASAGGLGKAEQCSARSMLDNHLIRKVAADNLVSTGRRLLGISDEVAAKAAVDAVYTNASSRLATVAPEANRRLSSVMLERSQQDAVLSSVQLVGARRVQSVGLDVARAIRSSRSTDRGQVRRVIESRLGPLAGTLVKLRNQLVPGEVQKLWDSEHSWELTLDPENVHAMRAGGSATDLLSEHDLLLDGAGAGAGAAPAGPPREPPSRGGSDAAPAEMARRRAVLAEGAAQQARLLLHVLARMADLPDRDVRAAVAAVGGAAGGPADAAHRALADGAFGGAGGARGPQAGQLSCVAPSSASSLAERGHAERALLCALRLGVQGMDALRASSELSRILPDSAFGSSGEMDVSSIGFT